MLMIVHKEETTVTYQCGKLVITAPVEVIPSECGKFALKGFYDHNGKWHTLSRI